jgi:hypothetical protein
MLEPYLNADESGIRPRSKVKRAFFSGDDEVPERRAFMVNQIFELTAWGHEWIYDFDELRHAAVRAGFSPEAIIEVAFKRGRAAGLSELDAPAHDDESLYVEIER